MVEQEAYLKPLNNPTCEKGCLDRDSKPHCCTTFFFPLAAYIQYEGCDCVAWLATFFPCVYIYLCICWEPKLVGSFTYDMRVLVLGLEVGRQDFFRAGWVFEVGGEMREHVFLQWVDLDCVIVVIINKYSQ